MEREMPKCPVAVTMCFLKDKWTILIMYTLTKCGHPMRFGELQRALPDISTKVLTQNLRRMEEQNLVSRKVYAEVPPRVEYALTEMGESLKPILNNMEKWGENYKKKVSVKILA